jgi:hypothetical protein
MKDIKITKIMDILVSKNIAFKYDNGKIEIKQYSMEFIEGAVLFHDYMGEVSHLFTIKEVKNYLDNYLI